MMGSRTKYHKCGKGSNKVRWVMGWSNQRWEEEVWKGEEVIGSDGYQRREREGRGDGMVGWVMGT